MKKAFYLACLTATLFGIYSFKLQQAYDNIFNQMGLQTDEAESYITGNLFGGSASFPRTAILAKLVMNKRAEVVTEMGRYIKAYLQSAAFKKAYETARQEQKPERPTDPLYSGPESMADYKEEVKRWEAEYPAVFNVLLKKRLQHFLQLTSGIDYAAKLERHGAKMYFADPALEAKDELWKACFRAGKPTVDAARAFAQQWLQELK